MLRASLRFQHGCDVNRLSLAHPQVGLAQWCNMRVEILEVQNPPGELGEAFLRDLGALAARGKGRRGARLQGAGDHGSGRVTLFRPCKHRPGTTMSEIVERQGCLMLYPLVYRGGWEHYRVVAPDEERLRRAVQGLARKGRVELESKRRIAGGLMSKAFMVPTDELLAELTGKQAEALVAAIEAGYYRVPRKVRTEDIARRRKVPRTTFEEHVRKAEAKIMASVGPYVALRASSGTVTRG